MKWMTKQGEYLDVKDMDILHIQNCINHLENKTLEMPFPNFQGDMAQMIAEQDYDSEQEAIQEKIQGFKSEVKCRQGGQ